MQKKQLAVILGGIALLFFVIVIIAGMRVKPQEQLQQTQNTRKIQEQIHEKQVAETKRLLAMDVSDPSHVTNIKYIQSGLEKYFGDYRYYPKKMEEMVPQYLRILPLYGTGKSYYYAYYPKDKPTAYHLGSPLGGRNPSDVKTFSEDADFVSKKAGYIGGFDGKDPVYDLVSGKK